ncbi:phosphohydrolase [Acutalibacter caecimuris]|uniref:phosphohydrolase n=1 Tax=Acutalibacter caecimuris TaxID=3093657 RepID=UPI002AC9456C|nr:phosphohydrolase [Acutalibacter sp. M00118]
MRYQWDPQSFWGCYQELTETSNLGTMAGYPQHGNTCRLLHSVAVAYYSCRIAAFLRLRFHMREMARGALFHDYFFYDAQDGDPAHKKHWSRHPEIAWRNAARELELTGIEADIIRTHMFPLTLRPPRYREGAVVTLVDKGCSVYEFFKRKRPYPRLVGRI